ncbi:hypothetical protein [Paraburkholderia lacunae]|uniref:Uncharacterized protein n=1 Tax=Paraburkholderia lacunae TaxID=2211104 RepID=A0A370N7J0_9BURK|nr:hypothetical protein [Paraburkholderia lacunae]RDK01478.1 hypothetical protein DLM46_16780 [Paraburkholderia lacunae]
MDYDDRVFTGSLLPASGGWRCRLMRGLLMLMVHERASASPQASADERAVPESGCATLAVDVSRTFQLETGYATSAIALNAAVDEKLALARFLAPGGSSAAVLLMDADVLSRIWPPCDWKTPLLQVRNWLADEGSKFFVALTTLDKGRGVSAPLGRLRALFVAQRVEKFCSQQGMGFLGTVESVPEMVTMPRVSPIHERAAAVIAHRLASAKFFCCDAFRIGSGNVHNLSQMRG